MSPSIRPATILLLSLLACMLIIGGWAVSSPEAMLQVAFGRHRAVLAVAAIGCGALGLWAVTMGRGPDKAIGGTIVAIAAYAGMFAAVSGGAVIPGDDADEIVELFGTWESDDVDRSVDPAEAYEMMANAQQRFDEITALLQEAEG